MIKYTPEKLIAIIGEHGNETLEFNYIRWENNEPKYDLRRWNGDKPLKGVTMTREEAELLYQVLGDELYPDDEPKEIQLDYRSFFVVRSLVPCVNQNHTLYEVEAEVPCLINGMIKKAIFKASYCENCNVYFVTEPEFERLRSSGKVLCQILTEAEYERKKRGVRFADLNPQGPLMMLGYTVKQGALTDRERKQILEWIIVNDILDKDLVIFYLESFMSRSQGNPNMSSAVKKWREDRDYLMGIDSLGKNAPPMGVARFIKGAPGFIEEELPFS